jgi:hypothetical protein
MLNASMSASMAFASSDGKAIFIVISSSF